LILLVMALGGCATTPRARPTVTVDMPPAPTKEWEGVINADDTGRLATFGTLWKSALASAKPRFGAALAKEGVLLDPEAGLDHPAPPPGSYRCRVVKLGAANRTQPAYRAYPTFFCYVRGDGNTLSFAKQTGAERPSGWLYPDDDKRFIFLGAYGVGDAKAPAYGTVPKRDALGVVERVAPFRWRLTLAPTDRSAPLTIYDMTPVPAELQGRGTGGATN
jgi:hypothetical protein